MVSSIPVPRSDNVNSTLPVPCSIYVWIEQAGVWFIANHKDVISVTERIARDRREETVLKRRCNAREIDHDISRVVRHPEALGAPGISFETAFRCAEPRRATA
jgi:hypothetical protein